MGLKCAFFPLALHRVLCSSYMRAQGIKPSSEFMAALPFNVCLRHNEGAEIPFCGRMLRLFSPYLTPSDHPLHLIFLYNPDSYFSHFLPLLKPLVSHCHRAVTMFLSKAPLQPCWLSPVLWCKLCSCPGDPISQLTVLTSPPCIPHAQYHWLSALLPAAHSGSALAPSVLHLHCLGCSRVSPQTGLSVFEHWPWDGVKFSK